MPEDLDPVWLERGSEVRVSAWLDRREQDMVWRVGRRRGETDFYLLLEFQSEIDPQMEVRMSVYRGLLHQDLVRGREIPAGMDLPFSYRLYCIMASSCGSVASRFRAPATRFC